MLEGDLPVVLRNEQRAYTYPWTAGIFTDCMKAGHECRVLLADEQVVGHAVMSLAVGEAHLLNVCVQRDQQGQGYGRRFVGHLVERAAQLGAQTLFLEVRPSNRVAVRLYDTLGFNQIGVRKDYYPAQDGREDAWVMALPLLDESAPED